MRVMFTQNANRAKELTEKNKESEYFMLYYQFIKHAFGLRHIEPADSGTILRLYLDNLPDTKEKVSNFKGYLLGLQHSPGFQRARIRLAAENITEVESKDHVLLQCLDVVLGSMAFRLNDRHKEIPPGKKRRGKRTRAKERLYKFILKRIRQTHPHFNPGISTGNAFGPASRWVAPYQHWCFVAKASEKDDTLTKGFSRQKKR